MKIAILVFAALLPFACFAEAESQCQGRAREAAEALAKLNGHEAIEAVSTLDEKTYTFDVQVFADGEPDRLAKYNITTTGDHVCDITGFKWESTVNK